MSKPRRPTEYWPTEHGVMTPDRARDTTSGPWYLKDEVKAELDDLRRENARLRGVLEDVESVLDAQLGDTDPYIEDGMTDDGIKDQEPLYWAMILIARTLRETTEAKTETCRWIDAKQSLPMAGQAVLFVVDEPTEAHHGRVLGGQFTPLTSRSQRTDFSTPGIGWRASHWMPAPEPPIEIVS